MTGGAELTPLPADVAGPLADDLCWLLSRATHGLLSDLTAGLEQIGISPRAHQVLVAAATGPRTQIEIARAIGLDKTTMVVTLDELERDGLAERQPSPTDRRARVVAVTPAGARKLQEADAILSRAREDALSVLPADERATFLRALARIVHARPA